MVTEFERIHDEIYVRSKPHMGKNVPYSARRVCWPVPQYAVYRNNTKPTLPESDIPPVLPLQPWKHYRDVEVSVSLNLLPTIHH